MRVCEVSPNSIFSIFLFEKTIKIPSYFFIDDHKKVLKNRSIFISVGAYKYIYWT